MTGWFTETLHSDFRLALQGSTVLCETETAHQKLVILENDTFGRVMMLDSVFQTTERDEFIYHEMLTHVPILAHGSVQSVLIIGGGDGGALEEVLKHKDIQKVTMVEIDETVVEMSKKYLTSICGNAFDDPRTNLVIADASDFIASCKEQYDVIIIDSTDPIGPGEVLFTKHFYQSCQQCLTYSGILITQNGMPFLQMQELRDSLSNLKELFSDVACYTATIPTYSGGVMAFGWATDDPTLRTETFGTLNRRFEQTEIETLYYTPEVHQAAFTLPPYIKRIRDNAV